jgi:hypothetical protein
VLQQVAELGHERGVSDRRLVGRRQLVEGLFERFRNVSTTELTELTGCRHAVTHARDRQKRGDRGTGSAATATAVASALAVATGGSGHGAATVGV